MPNDCFGLFDLYLFRCCKTSEQFSLYPINLIRIKFKPSSRELVVFLFSFDSVSFSFTTCSLNYRKSNILTGEGELNV